MALKADIVEVRPRNDAVYDNTLTILRNGEDNAYPTRVERIINSSVTAKQCAKILTKFIYGRGFEDSTVDKAIVGRDKRGVVTGLQLLKKIANSLATHQGVFLHINYNILGEKTTVAVIPYRWARFTQETKESEVSGVSVYDNWDKTKQMNIKKENILRFPFYNPNPDVVRSQIEDSGGIAFYQGQVLFYTLDENSMYPLSTIDPAMYDADTDGQISVFKNRTIRDGFMAKTVIRHMPFDSESDKDDFKQNVKTWQGAENAETILLVQDDFTSDFPNGTMKIDQLETKINDKLFESWENSIPNKIRKCFNNIPPVLVDVVEGKLGDTSGESYKVAVDFYNRQTEEERMAVTELLTNVFTNFSRPVGVNYNILAVEPLLTTTANAPIN